MGGDSDGFSLKRRYSCEALYDGWTWIRSKCRIVSFVVLIRAEVAAEVSYVDICDIVLRQGWVLMCVVGIRIGSICRGNRVLKSGLEQGNQDACFNN